MSVHFHVKEKDRSSVHLIYINNDVKYTSVALYKTIYMYPRIFGNVDETTGNILFISCSFPRLIELHRQFDSDLIRSRLTRSQGRLSMTNGEFKNIVDNSRLNTKKITPLLSLE